MGSRSLAKVAALAVALTVTASCSRERPGAALLPGEEVPPAWLPRDAAAAPLVLYWTFRTEDCLACMKVDRSLRRVQAKYGESVPVVAVHVGGEPESEVARAFLSSARVRARLLTVSPGDFHERYPGAGIPSLLLARAGKIVWSSAAPAGPEGIRPQPLENTVSSFLPGAGAGPKRGGG